MSRRVSCRCADLGDGSPTRQDFGLAEADERDARAQDASG